MNPDQVADILARTHDIGTVKHTEFQDYVLVLEKKKKVGDGEWITTENPYMAVDGRLSMANQDHARQGKRLDIGQPIILEDTEKKLTLTVRVDSEIYGTRHGTATSRLIGGTPNERDFPWETAETSAIGRALGAMGYGLLPGSGLTSAEDMQRVAASRNNGNNNRAQQPQRQQPQRSGESSGPVRRHPPLSPVQRAKLIELYEKLHGADPEQQGLDKLFQEHFHHGLADAFYEEGARMTGMLLAELHKRADAPAQPAAADKAPVPTDNGAKRYATPAKINTRQFPALAHKMVTYGYAPDDKTAQTRLPLIAGLVGFPEITDRNLESVWNAVSKYYENQRAAA